MFLISTWPNFARSPALYVAQCNIFNFRSTWYHCWENMGPHRWRIRDPIGVSCTCWSTTNGKYQFHTCVDSCCATKSTAIHTFVYMSPDIPKSMFAYFHICPFAYIHTHILIPFGPISKQSSSKTIVVKTKEKTSITLYANRMVYMYTQCAQALLRHYYCKQNSFCGDANINKAH